MAILDKITDFYYNTSVFVYTSVDKNMTSPQNIIRVSVSEAARLLGIDPHTIRRALKRQELRYIIVQGRYKINFESLIEWSQQRVTVKNKMESQGIGQFVEKWKIKNKKFSPNPTIFKDDKSSEL